MKVNTLYFMDFSYFIYLFIYLLIMFWFMAKRSVPISFPVEREKRRKASRQRGAKKSPEHGGGERNKRNRLQLSFPFLPLPPSIIFAFFRFMLLRNSRALENETTDMGFFTPSERSLTPY